jgi:hypothetical protein
VRQYPTMRNPDKWLPREPESPSSRRGALAGLIVVLLLVAGGMALTHVLRGMAALQDCVLSGRSNCR